MIRLLFGFQGRINRAQYWTGALISGFVALLLIVTMITMSPHGKELAADPKDAMGHLGGLLLGFLVVLFGAAWCGLALQVKRFHDRGKSGWMAAIPAGLGGLVGFLAVVMPIALIGLLPIIGLAMMGVNIWFLVELGCLPGVGGPNQFGDPPGSGGNAPASPAPRSPFDASPRPTSLQTAEAAMERAIAERKVQPAMREPVMAPRPVAASAGPRTAAPASFGRRPAR